jgi:hypothetical protein
MIENARLRPQPSGRRSFGDRAHVKAVEASSNRRATALSFLLLFSACSQADEPDVRGAELGESASSLTAAQRHVRAGQIRDAALQSGVSEGYLLAGIAEAETMMSHCWSELTWACQGPASADCGGGPVVAGSGDGPCSVQQGGLGMFQFDAGTYDQTLAREGRRVLTIAGNVEAAVDFVVAMLIRSTYISGVDDEAQAIRWLNGVRIGNDRWDAWVRTVTHYYNGCTPQASCWPSRYARYGDTAIRVHDEFGDAFWRVEQTPRLMATYVDQSFPLASEPLQLAPGQEEEGYIELRNEGTEIWRADHTFLTTSDRRAGASALATAGWSTPARPATVRRDVARGESAAFMFSLRAPSSPGSYRQFFTLVHDDTWFADVGGLPDDQLQVWVEVKPAVHADAATRPTVTAVSGSDAAIAVESLPASSADAAPSTPVSQPPAASGSEQGTRASDVADAGARRLADAQLGSSNTQVADHEGCSLRSGAPRSGPASWSLISCALFVGARRIGRSVRRGRPRSTARGSRVR